MASVPPISLSKLDYPLLLLQFLDRSRHRENFCDPVTWAYTRLLVFADGITVESRKTPRI